MKRTEVLGCKKGDQWPDERFSWPLKFWLLAACLSFLLAGLVGYLSVVVPLKRQIMVEQARGVAQSVDSVVKSRSASVATAVRGLDLETLVSENGGTQALNGLRDQFPDFLSLEVLNDAGELLAMFGDVSLDEAGRKGRAEDAATPGSGKGSFRDPFHDYPQGDCFFITTTQTAADGNTLFSRARFTREPIGTALASFDGSWAADLQPVSSPSPQAPSAGESSRAPSVVVFSSWRSREAKAEVQLLTPGWTIVMKGKSAGTFLSRYLIVAVGTLLAILALTYVQKRRGAAAGKATGQYAKAKETKPRPSVSIQPPEVGPEPALLSEDPDSNAHEAPIENEPESIEDDKTVEVGFARDHSQGLIKGARNCGGLSGGMDLLGLAHARNVGAGLAVCPPEPAQGPALAKPDPAFEPAPAVSMSPHTEEGVLRVVTGDLPPEEAERQQAQQPCKEQEETDLYTVTDSSSLAPPSARSMIDRDTSLEAAKSIGPAPPAEPPSSWETQPDLETLQIEFPVPEEASDAVPEFLEVTWMEPDTKGDSQDKRRNQYVCPSTFAGF